MILHLTESPIIHLGRTGLSLSAADPRAVARLRAAGHFVPRAPKPIAALYAKRSAQFDAAGDASRTAAPPTAMVAGDLRQFSGLAYGGGLVPSPFGMGNVVIDLATLAAGAPLPLLNMHDHAAIVGKVASVTNDGWQLTDAGELFSDFDPTAQGIAQRAGRGIPFQQSVGVYDFREEEIRAGQSVNINGRSFIGPLTILRNGTVREISICPLGADATTSAAIFNAGQPAPNSPSAGTFTARTPMSTSELYRRSNRNQ